MTTESGGDTPKFGAGLDASTLEILKSSDDGMTVAPGEFETSGDDPGEEADTGQGKALTTATDDPYGDLGEEDNSEEAEGDGEGAGAGVEGNGEEGEGNEPTFREVLSEQLATQLGRSVELPEDLNEDNFAEKLMELGRKQLHPEALRLQNAIENGLDPREYYNQANQFDRMLELSDQELVGRQLMARYGKSDENPDGMTEEEILARVKKLEENGDLKLQAIELRKAIRTAKADRDKELEQYASSNRGPDITSPEYKKQFDKNLDEAFGAAFKERELYGLKFANEKGFGKVKDRLNQILFPDAKTGVSEFVQAMNDPKEAVKIALLWDMARSGKLNLDIKQASAAARRSAASFLDGRNKKTAAAKTGAQGLNKDFFRHFAQ